MNIIYKMVATVALFAHGIAFAANSATETAPSTPAAAPAVAKAPEAKQEMTPAEMARISEAFGHFIGRNLKSPGIQFDLESIVKGIRDGAAGKPAPMSDEEYEQAMIAVQQNAFAKISQSNLQAANDFLTSNAAKANVKELQPGKLQYEIVKEGSGTAVEPHGNVQINYVGKFIDGTVFGSSKESGGPVTLSLDQTVPGFSLGLVGMKEGEERRLYVHPDLGYGTSGQLPPNSLLIFDVEMLKAKAPVAQDSDAGDDNSDDEVESDEEIFALPQQGQGQQAPASSK
jgi:peptidylprolyl isomerase